MKKAKLIPSIIMFILCVAVLAIGVYAISPTVHNVVGTVKITAGGTNVRITAYLGDTDGDYSNDIQVSNVYTSRSRIELSLYDSILDFDCTSAFDISEVDAKQLYFKVENLSSYSVGAYFLDGTIGASGTERNNIATAKNFNGTMGNQTITNLITANFSTYTEIAGNNYAYMYSALTLNQLNAEASTVVISLNINIEEFNESLLPSLDNAIQLKNSENLNIVAKCDSIYSNSENVKTIYNNGVWGMDGLAFSSESYPNGQLRLKTIKMNMCIVNNSNVTISADIISEAGNTEQSSSVRVTTFGNPYIEPGESGEVSVQFSAVYNRNNSTITTAPTINTFSYSVVVTPVERLVDSYVYDLITYDNDTTDGSMPSKGFNYYIEYGDNPYVANEKLRWYVWAKDNGYGKPIALETSDEITDSVTAKKKLVKGNTYYFISEHILNVSDSQLGISFQAERNYVSQSKNYYGDFASDYAGSNIRDYINGLTVTDSSVNDSVNKQYMQNGEIVNFLSTFNLVDSPIYSLINKRSLNSLYNDMERTINDDSTYAFPINNPNVSINNSDRFWLLSLKEYYYIFGEGSQRGATTPIAGTYKESGYWMRSPCCSREAGVAYYDGYLYEFDTDVNFYGVRPSFMLVV